LDTDEEEMVQQLMVLKQASRSIGRVGNEKSLLEGSTVFNSDLDFVIDENMVHITESTVSRRYAGWFIRNTEHAQRVYDGLKNSPLPVPIKLAHPHPPPQQQQPGQTQQLQSAAQGKSVAWGGIKTFA